LWKSTVSFVKSVHLSVRMEQLGFHWTNMYEFWYLSIFLKFVEKVQVFFFFFKSDNNNGYFCAYKYTFFIISCLILLGMKMFQMKVVEKIRTHIYFSITFFFIYKIVSFVRYCGKILYSRAGHRWQYGARALHAGYVGLQTHIQKFFIINFFPLQHWSHERVTVLLYTYIAFLFYWFTRRDILVMILYLWLWVVLC
jgi:hypothetical protein